jgi:hypothetical protein
VDRVLGLPIPVELPRGLGLPAGEAVSDRVEVADPLPEPLKEGCVEALARPLGLNEPDVLDDRLVHPLDVIDPEPVADSSAVGV